MNNIANAAGKLAISEKYKTAESIKALFEECSRELDKEDTWIDLVTVVGQKPR